MSYTDIKNAMANLRDYAEGKVRGGLLSACPVVLRAIFEDRSWDDDTRNLRDSFGWALFEGSKEIARGFLGDKEATTPRKAKGAMRSVVGSDDIWGREQVESFLDDYEPTLGATYEVVFVAGMYYAVYLEWKNLLIGFVNGEEAAKEETIRAIKMSYEPLYNKR